MVMIVHSVNFSSSGIFFWANIMMGWLVSNSTFAVIVAGRVVLNDYVLSVDLISQLPGHDRLLILPQNPTAC